MLAMVRLFHSQQLPHKHEDCILPNKKREQKPLKGFHSNEPLHTKSLSENPDFALGLERIEDGFRISSKEEG